MAVAALRCGRPAAATTASANAPATAIGLAIWLGLNSAEFCRVDEARPAARGAHAMKLKLHGKSNIAKLARAQDRAKPRLAICVVNLQC
mmetsp:Transcript_4379/g.6115  ORF Transcript_4379/g.6115 Transcript_4379/m.6115 type:complete len:89 (-) Transcript_4379:39-305(-)